MFFLKRTSAAETPLPFAINLDGKPVTITPRRNALARRMVLRATKDGQGFALTLPRRHNQRAIQEFLQTSSDWMRAQLSKQPPKALLANGVKIMLRGEDVVVQTTGKLRGTVAYDAETKTLTLPGATSHIERRLTDWLKKQALTDASLCVCNERHLQAHCRARSKEPLGFLHCRWHLVLFMATRPRTSVCVGLRCST
jgi:predicted metal-dependent hydrolase